MDYRATIGIIGGSGLYSLFESSNELDVDTPYGPASDRVSIGLLNGRRVAFLPRHGRDHGAPPHAINYRANIWALQSVGVRQIVAPAAVGSLCPELDAGSLIVPDQLVDRTHGRDNTYFDGAVRPDGRRPNVVHLPFSDPYCPTGRSAALHAARAIGWPAADTGTLVVINGPRFSTRAESAWHSAQGWQIVGMTGHPEAALARELGICYTTLALVTDRDVGAGDGAGVTHDEVLAAFAKNVERLKSVLQGTVRSLPEEPACGCAGALRGTDLGIDVP